MSGPLRRNRRDTADEALLRTLYDDHGRALLAYAIRLTGDRGAAEDVVQETLVRAWRHCDDLIAERGSVRGWLLTVARNVVIDRVRARTARPPEVRAFEDSTASPVGDHAQAVVDKVVVMGAMDDLSHEHRQVLQELYFHGLTVTEAAEVLALPPGTVKSRSYYALRAMRALLEPRAPAPSVAMT